MGVGWPRWVDGDGLFGIGKLKWAGLDGSLTEMVRRLRWTADWDGTLAGVGL